MSKQSRLLGLAAIIPTYTNVSLEEEYDFSITQKIYKNVTILDAIIAQCKHLNVNTIILVCKPDQILYLRYKYGDAITFLKGKDLYKVINILYITVSNRYYNKFDSILFNLIYGAYILNSAVLDSFGVEFSNYYLLIDPRHILDPTVPAAAFTPIREYLYSKQKQGEMIFSHEENRLRNYSYSFIKTETIQVIWNTFKKFIREDKISKIDFAKLTFDKVYDSIKTPDKIFNLQIPTFDLYTWNDYVTLLSYIQAREEDYRENMFKNCNFKRTTLTTVQDTKNIIHEPPFVSKVVNFNNSTKLWHKKRMELRNKNAGIEK